MDSIPGFSGYFADRSGKVYTTRRSGSKRTDFPLKAMKSWQHNRKTKHRVIKLIGESGERQRFYLSHVILMTFTGPRPPNAIARHKNDIADDDRAENLEWGYQSDNNKDFYRNYRLYKDFYNSCRSL